MNIEVGRWTYSLLFASLLVILGTVSLVVARGISARWLASCVFMQGVLLMFVVSAAHVNLTTDSKLGALVIVALLLIHSATEPNGPDDDDPFVEGKRV